MKNIERLRVYELEWKRGRIRERVRRERWKAAIPLLCVRFPRKIYRRGRWNRPRCRAARGTKAIVEANFKLSKPRFERRGGIGRGGGTRDARGKPSSAAPWPIPPLRQRPESSVARSSQVRNSVCLGLSSCCILAPFLRNPCGIKIEHARGYRDRLGSERYTGCPSLSVILLKISFEFFYSNILYTLNFPFHFLVPQSFIYS